MERPDAVKFPATESTKKPIPPEEILPRFNKLLKRAETLLEIQQGEKVALRKQMIGAYWFATRDPKASLLFPTHHDLEGQPRYTWKAHPTMPRVELGYLVPEAREG